MSKRLSVTLTRKCPKFTSSPEAFPVTLTAHAEKRLHTSYLIARAENRADADLWTRTVRDKIVGLDKAAEGYPVAPESRLFGQDIRELVLSDIALRVLYRIDKASVQVLDVQRLRTNCGGA